MTQTLLKTFVIALTLFVVFDTSKGEGAADFNYCYNSGKGPDSWPITFSHFCAGKSQSPINLIYKRLHSAPPLTWTGYDATPSTMNVTNDGKTVSFSATWPDDKPPTISGGFLKHTYKLVNFHFHWGMTNIFGSEHAINGMFYPIETHFVHMRSDLNSVQEAVKHPDGLVVLGYLGTVSLQAGVDGDMNDVLGKTLPQLYKPRTVAVEPVSLRKFMFPFQKDYFTYQGSLTTPTCNEAVTWMVQTYVYGISGDVLKKFRKLSQSNKCMINNFRPIQKINGRKVVFVNKANV